MRDKPLAGWDKAHQTGRAGAVAQALHNPSLLQDPNFHSFVDTSEGRAIAESIIFDGPNKNNLSLAVDGFRRFVDQLNTVPEIPDGTEIEE